MNNYNLGLGLNIDTNEVSSVREMIFNRAKEKSSSLVAEKEENMTSSVKNDVMDSARASIVNKNAKPLFGNLTQNIKSAEDTGVVEQNAQKITPQLKHNVQSVNNQKYTDSMRDETMLAARNQYNRRASLNETLQFLNTQAAIQMVSKTHSKIV